MFMGHRRFCLARIRVGHREGLRDLVRVEHGLPRNAVAEEEVHEHEEDQEKESSSEETPVTSMIQCLISAVWLPLILEIGLKVSENVGNFKKRNDFLLQPRDCKKPAPRDSGRA